MTSLRIPRVLSIAGSDSGGGAGIQADLKAIAACGAHGMTAITAITAQNTVEVRAVHPIPAAVIKAQVAAVHDDIGLDAVKIGMLGDAATVRAVAEALDALPEGLPVVLDPVMVAESGAELLAEEARQALLTELLPRATVITPNIPEALALIAAAGDGPAGGGAGGRAGSKLLGPQVGGDVEAGGVDGEADRGANGDQSAPEAEGADGDQSTSEAEAAEIVALARRLRELGPRVVVITGGHRRAATDIFFDGSRLEAIPGERHPDGAGHGSGCTHSSVLAARLAWGDDPLTAAREAKAMASRAVRDGLRSLGAGAGPVNVLGLGGGAISLAAGCAGSAGEGSRSRPRPRRR